MANLIFFEGVPGVGKSTLIEKVQKRLQIPVFQRHPELDSQSLHYDFNLKTFKELNEDMIFDRGIWSDVVFSHIKNHEDVMPEFQDMRARLRQYHKYFVVYLERDKPLQTHSNYSWVELAAMWGIYEKLLINEPTLYYDIDKNSTEVIIGSIADGYKELCLNL